ncbi:uncharacterized protein LOC141953273 [Strix uralensis]|uniref:uncharacterized protein LOC141953273 n=1 Tax=Strix uralensis TaxID=36305 RepID=UPI003DA77FC0
MRRGRGAGLAGLAAVLLVAAGRAQVQQEPSAETNEGTGVTINCSHPNIQSNDYICWFRQLPGRAPAFLAFTVKGSRELQAPPGRLSVAADRRSSALWLARPRRGDAAVYYCALGDTGRGAGAAAGHEPPRAGPASLHVRRSQLATGQLSNQHTQEVSTVEYLATAVSPYMAKAHSNKAETGNSLILVTVGSEQPPSLLMCFPLGTLSYLEICCATTIVP